MEKLETPSSPTHRFSKWGGQNCAIFSISWRRLHAGCGGGDFCSLVLRRVFKIYFGVLKDASLRFGKNFIIQQKSGVVMVPRSPGFVSHALCIYNPNVERTVLRESMAGIWFPCLWYVKRWVQSNSRTNHSWIWCTGLNNRKWLFCDWFDFWCD